MTKKLIEIASEIVQAQVSLTHMSGVEITSSLRQVFSTLCELQKAETTGIDIECIQPVAKEVAEAKLTPLDSIQENKIICLECGAEMKQLTQKHLASHDMSTKEYRLKYGFTMRTPLSAKALTKARSKAAKKRGLPEKLQMYIDARRQEKAAASTQAATATVTAGKPKRTRIRKK